jgi:hypothetical protein
MFQTKDKTMNKFVFTLIIFALISHAKLARADREGMSEMPILKPKSSYTVPSKDAGEALLEQRGYGDKEPEVKMMNLMMVRGSGFEGMDMDQMKMADAKSPATNHSMGSITAGTNDAETIELTVPSAAGKVGPNIYEFSVKDKNGKALKGLKIKTQVYMLSMDMGTESPKVKETKPGVYQTKANFSMGGPWALKIITPSSEKVFEIQAGK